MGRLTQNEIDEAIKTSEYCGITLSEAIEMNKDFRDNTEYFETNYPDFY